MQARPNDNNKLDEGIDRTSEWTWYQGDICGLAQQLNTSHAAKIEAFKFTSDVQIIFVTPEWLFTEQLDSMSKLKMLEEANQLSLIAIDEAHLPGIMTKLQSFLHNPVIEKGSVYCSNIFLEASQDNVAVAMWQIFVICTILALYTHLVNFSNIRSIYTL